MCLAGAVEADTVPGASAPDILYSAETGAPLIRNFPPTEYNGAVQNWVTVQDRRGVIYVGNVEDGVLEFDGIRWRRIPTTNRTVVRSMAVADDGRIYVGALGEVGYLAPDESGVTRYVSLLERIPPEYRDFADVWRTFATPEGVYFETFKRLIRFDPHGGVRVWNADTTFHLAFYVRGTLYVREVGRGLLRLAGDQLEKVPQGEQFADEKIYIMLPWPGPVAANDRKPGALLLGTRTRGWFIWENGTFRPWKTEADAALNAAMLYCGRWLAGGTALAVGTLHQGIFLLSRTGGLVGHIDKSIGLESDSVFDLFQDARAGLWAAMDAGIARIDVGSPLTRFSQQSGIDGAIITIARHDGTLYAGTTQGLYRLQTDERDATRFVRVPIIQGQAWSFLSLPDRLLVTNLQGVYEIRGSEVTLVRPSSQVSFSLARSVQDPARVFVGLQNGLASMRLQAGRWVDEGLVDGVSDEVRTMVQEDNGQLWMGTLSTGIVRLSFPDAQRHTPVRLTPVVEHFGRAQGLLPPSSTNVYAIGGRPVFTTTHGILRFDPRTSHFDPDPRFARLFGEDSRLVSPVLENAHGDVWMFTSTETKTVREAGVARLTNGAYRWDPRPLRQIAGSAVASIYADPDGVLWLGGEDSIYRYDPRVPLDFGQPFAALVRAVSDRNGHRIFGGAGAARTPTLDYAKNALRFEIAAPSYGIQPSRFEVLLEGVDSEWSPWSTEAYRDYTNIHEGTYTFHVRAMNEFGSVSQQGAYSLRILPPWYRTWWAYMAYAILGAAVFFGISRWRSMTLRKRNLLLAKLVAQRTRQLSDANQALQSANIALAERSVTDSLTGLKNRRYLLDHLDRDVAAVRRACEDSAGKAEPPVSILFLMLDVDHFKEINDRFGHIAGDQVIEQLAHIVKDACRGSDIPVRWGGEEFLIVARLTDRNGAPAFAERIRSMVAAHTFDLGQGETLQRTCSLGFAMYPLCPSAPDRFSWQDVVNLADQGLYAAKRGGRNTWVGVRATQKVPPAAAEANGAADLEELVSLGYLSVQNGSTRNPAPPSASLSVVQSRAMGQK